LEVTIVTETQAALRAKRKDRLAEYAREEGQPEQEPIEAQAAEETQVEAQAEKTPADNEGTEVDASTASEAQEGTTLTDGGQSYDDEPAPAPEAESAGQQLIAEVSPLDEIQTDAPVDMVLFQYDEDPAWAVFASGMPVAEIRLSDQPNAADIRPLFESKSYSDTLRKACAKDGLQQTLAGIPHRSYASALDRSAVVAKIRDEMVEAEKDSLREKQAAAANDLMNALGLVLQAMDKGVLVQSNPLKTALYEALASVGVSKPVQTVESAFEKAGPAFFEAALAQAQEWVGYSPEAYAQLEATVTKSPRYQPQEPSVAKPPASPQAEHQAAFPQNVPLETRTATQTPDPKSALKAKLGIK
jgi:hypothetical protein